MTDLPVLNAQQALFRLGNHQPLYQRLLTLFDKQAHEVLSQVESNHPLTVMSAHTLKGSAAEIGAERLREVMQQAEYAIRKDGTADPQLLIRISTELLHVRKEIARYLQD